MDLVADFPSCSQSPPVPISQVKVKEAKAQMCTDAAAKIFTNISGHVDDYLTYTVERNAVEMIKLWKKKGKNMTTNECLDYRAVSGLVDVLVTLKKKKVTLLTVSVCLFIYYVFYLTSALNC